MTGIGRFTSPLAACSVPRLAGTRTSQPTTGSVYRHYVFRLASFEQWRLLGVLSALKFCEAGFHCTGRGDATACFSCGLTLGGWTSEMSPSAVHAKLNGGQCAFVNDRDSTVNVANGDTQVIEDSKFDLSTVQSAPAASGLAAHSDARNGTSTSTIRRQIVNRSASIAAEVLDGIVSNDFSRRLTGLHIAVGDVISSAFVRRRGRTSSVTVRGSAATRHDEEAVKREAYRLSTFANIWKYSSIVTPQELAAAGFHYAGPGDRVQCAFCQGLLRNWEPGDLAMALHAQHFTYCRFVQGHDVGNIPIPFVPLTADSNPVVEDTHADEADSALGISCALPKHPDFAVESRRQATFATWPCSAGGSSATDALARAGFFYLGSERAVECFHCSGTVEDWPLGADPWAEHARRYPDCTFVVHAKGRGFIEQCGSASVGNILVTPSAKFAVDPREIRARLDAAKVRILMRMDYPLDLLREVIQKRLAATGDDHETSETLLADLFTVHDEKQRSVQSSVIQGQRLHDALPVVLAQAQSRPALSTHDPDNVRERNCSAEAGTAVRATPSLRGNTSTAAALDNDNLVDSLVWLSGAAADRPSGKPTMSLSDENRQLKMQLTCKICLDSLIGVVFLPCGHFVCCPSCAPALTVCPMCRVSVRGTVRCLL